MTKHELKLKELASPDLSGSETLMQFSTLDMLSIMQRHYGKQLSFTSGYRTLEQNKRAKGSKNSSHLRGFAADVVCNSSTDRKKLVNAAFLAGFRRIGIGRTFVHVDNDQSLPQDVIWLY